MNMRGKPVTPAPPVIAIAIPLYRIIVDRVARIGRIDNRAISSPFKNPQRADTERARKTAARIAETAPAPPAIILVIVIAARMLDIVAIETTDRSMPPESMHSIIANAMNPNSGI
jgi:hypothetical protein